MRGRSLIVAGPALVALAALLIVGATASAAAPRPTCYGKHATIVGTSGPDVVVGTKKHDVVVALGGDDVISGLGDKDVVCAGDGEDVVEDGPGGAILDGGPGVDTVSFASATGPVTVDLGLGVASSGGHRDDALTSIESAVGSGFDDDLFGADDGNALTGGEGADLLQSFGGSDTLAGGPGDDILRGGPGADTADGGADTDQCVEAEGRIDCEQGGGPITIESRYRFDSTDPALAYHPVTWQMLDVIGLGLVRTDESTGTIVPDGARSLPVVSADGLTYTFTLRDRLVFSNGAAVTAAAFKSSIERAVRSGPGQSFLQDVVGVGDFVNGFTSEISGIVAERVTLRISLVKASGDLLARLGMPFFTVVPPGTPLPPGPSAGVTMIPSAGPYMLAVDAVSGATAPQVVIERNPFYQGRRASNADAIGWVFGADPAIAEWKVKNGESDVALAVPTPDIDALYHEYGPGTSPQRFVTYPRLTTWYLAFNTDTGCSRVPKFADPLLRQAVSYAIDRTFILEANLMSHTATPTDELVPSGMAGSRDDDVYPLDGDVATAAALAAAAGVDSTHRLGVVLYSGNSSWMPWVATYLQRTLAPLGIDVTVQLYDRVVQAAKVRTRCEPFDMTIDGWGADYNDPFSFLDVLLNGARIVPTANTNISYFDNVAFNARLDAASVLSGSARYAAYADLDRDAAIAAPAVGLFESVGYVFTGASVRGATGGHSDWVPLNLMWREP